MYIHIHMCIYIYIDLRTSIYLLCVAACLSRTTNSALTNSNHVHWLALHTHIAHPLYSSCAQWHSPHAHIYFAHIYYSCVCSGMLNKHTHIAHTSCSSCAQWYAQHTSICCTHTLCACSAIYDKAIHYATGDECKQQITVTNVHNKEAEKYTRWSWRIQKNAQECKQWSRLNARLNARKAKHAKQK